MIASGPLVISYSHITSTDFRTLGSKCHSKYYFFKSFYPMFILIREDKGSNQIMCDL
ncbi:hypothetical protein BDC45DRAFT_507438 [Circinella umbellata]|nr:hypothetical protein BDC45DRAFT_507438 [Circinella umbellata]